MDLGAPGADAGTRHRRRPRTRQARRSRNRQGDCAKGGAGKIARRRPPDARDDRPAKAHRQSAGGKEHSGRADRCRVHRPVDRAIRRGAGRSNPAISRRCWNWRRPGSSKGEASTLLAAHRLYSDLLQIMRLCSDEPVDAKSAAPGLKRMICLAADLPDFSAVVRELKNNQKAVRSNFERLLGRVPRAQSEGKRPAAGLHRG